MSLQRGLRVAQAAEMAVAVAALLAAAAALVADLLGREAFGQGIFGAQRAAVHFVFLAGMLGFVLAVGRGAHLRVKATDALLPAGWTPWIERIGRGAGLADSSGGWPITSATAAMAALASRN